MICQDSGSREFCTKFCRSVPCCDEIASDLPTPSLSPSDELGEPGFVVQLFEIGKILTEKKVVKFRCQGTCNYPCTKPGDILHIEPRSIEQIEIGDIAVFRRFNSLFSHRTIDKGKKENSWYIVTQPDRSSEGQNDGPSFEKDVLGVITTIERKGKFLSPAKRNYSSIKRRYFEFYLKCRGFKRYLFSKIVHSIVYIQRYGFYGKLASFLFFKQNQRADFSIRTDLNYKMAGPLYRIISPEEFASLDLTEKGNLTSKWTFVLSIDSNPVASLSVIFRPENCPFTGCWIAEAETRIRYRGTSIEERLFEETYAMLRQLGMHKISVSLFRDDRLKKIIFKKLGFRQMAVCPDAFSGDDGERPIIRIIMERDLQKQKNNIVNEYVISS